jgi:hypothetical protein
MHDTEKRIPSYRPRTLGCITITVYKLVAYFLFSFTTELQDFDGAFFHVITVDKAN